MTQIEKKFTFDIRQISLKYMIVLGLIAVSVLSAIGYYVWKKEEEGRQYRGATVEVEKVRKGSIERKIDAVGSLTANESVVIKPQVTGIIKAVHFKGGDIIKEGDPLVTIDDRLYKAQLKEAEAKLELAKINYDRKKKLFETNAGAKAKLDEAQSQLGVAEANVDSTKLKFTQTVVKAPFDGVAGIKMISLGDSVNEQKELLAFVDVDPMKIDFKVPSNFIQLLSIGQTVKVFVDGFEDKEFSAEIEEIDSRIDPQTHSLALRAKIPNKNGLLKPGLFGRVSLVAGSKDDALLVPASAVDVSGDEEFIYRVVKRSGHNVAEKVTITTGIRNDETIEIVRGLKEDDVVVISGQVKIQDSSIVRPIGLEEEKADETSANEKEDAKEGSSASDSSEAEETPATESDSSSKEDEPSADKKEEMSPKDNTDEREKESSDKKST